MATASLLHEDPEAEAALLIERYDRAVRDYIEATGDPSRVDTDRRRWEEHILQLEAIDARDALRMWIRENGPAESSTGIYRLDGDGRLSFRRIGHPEIGRLQPCEN